MSYVQEMMAFNEKFVAEKQYEAFKTSKLPDKKIVILSCMDTRLTELLPAALNLKNGDAKIIKNAGAVVTAPYGSVMRSILVAIYELGAEEIFIIAHHDCGMHQMKADQFIQKMLERNIHQEHIDMMSYFGIDAHQWLTGFADSTESVLETIALIRKHPMMPADVSIAGFLMDPETGKLDLVCNA